MPTYEYACTSCAHEWEFEQSIKDAALTECPSCHQATARRQISRGTGFILKGGGWYSDLYASSSNKPPEKSDKADGAANSKGAEAKGSEPKSAETKGAESKSTESKPSETKSASPSPGTSAAA